MQGTPDEIRRRYNLEEEKVSGSNFSLPEFISIDEPNEILGVDGTLEIAGDVYINTKLLKTWVVDSGTENGWHWKKYSDGTFEAYRGRRGIAVSCGQTGQLSGWYRSNKFNISLPDIGIASVDFAEITIRCSDASLALQFATVTTDTDTSKLYYFVNAPQAYLSQSRDIDYRVEGTWA